MSKIAEKIAPKVMSINKTISQIERTFYSIVAAIKHLFAFIKLMQKMIHSFSSFQHLTEENVLFRLLMARFEPESSGPLCQLCFNHLQQPFDPCFEKRTYLPKKLSI